MSLTTEKEALYTEYRDKVSRYVFCKLRNKNDAEDLVSEIFLKVYENLDTFDASLASVSTWIYTITRNAVTDYFRSNRTYSELPEEMSDGGGADCVVLQKESLAALGKALGKLDGRCRALVILKYYKKMSLKDIASRMGISYAYVKILHKSALNKLKNYLSD